MLHILLGFFFVKILHILKVAKSGCIRLVEGAVSVCAAENMVACKPIFPPNMCRGEKHNLSGIKQEPDICKYILGF